jgi:ATP-binding cassette subfamily B protein/subfamily B ATP-binding cassette protein MsbA
VAGLPWSRNYRRLLRYATADWKGWALIVGLTLLGSAFGLLQPWPMKLLVDHVLNGHPASPALARAMDLLPGGGTTQGLLAWLVLAGVGVFVLYSAVDVVLTQAWIRVGQRMVYRLAGDLFAHIQRRSLLFHSRNPVGDSLSRITGDCWCVYKVVDALLFGPGHALVVAAGMVVLMAGIDPGLTLLVVAVAPAMTATAFLFGGRIRALARARREAESRVQSQVQRVLSGIQVVQAFAQEERERLRFRDFTAAALEALRRTTLLAGRYGLVSGLVLTLGTGAVVLVGARHVLAGQLSVGGLLVFLAYLAALQTHLQAFTGIHATLQETGAGIDRVVEMLDAELEVQDRPGAVPLPAARGHVRLENVTFGYEPGRPVLRGVSLEALPGQTVAVVGATGAGKTTLVSLIPRFIDPWEGRVLVDGQDVRDVRLRDLRGQVAVVLQEPFLFPLSIADNIAYGRPGASRQQVEAAARAANLHAFVERLPGGYETVVGERGATLSGGERQRLSVARALLKHAPVLLLDEPTSALDAETEGLLLEALRRLMRGRTTLIIAHRLSTIRNADWIAVIDEGRVVERGTHAELLQRQGLYAHLHGVQFGLPAQVPPGGRP